MFGKISGNMSVEKEFKLVPHKYEEYKEGCVSTTVTETSWLTCDYIEWMRINQSEK